jgi:uncharacterized membrane protein (UPF0127 family)
MISKKTLKGSYRYIFTSFLILGTILSIYTTGQQNNIGKLKINNQLEVKINTCTFYLQKSSSTIEKDRGLMFIKSMDTSQGMIFLYNEPEYLSFWMLNTFIPLDIIYIDSNNQIVTIHNNTKPLNDNILYNSSSKSQYVIELNANITKLCKINVQDFTNFQK